MILNNPTLDIDFVWGTAQNVKCLVVLKSNNKLRKQGFGGSLPPSMLAYKQNMVRILCPRAIWMTFSHILVT